ncbi:MAG: esterase family protein [Ferruginibacter sp.]|nr:esterase family protein [Ferruginibacter sp.]
MKKNLSLFLGLFVLINFAFASIDTVSIYSNAMHRNIKAVVIKPDDYKKEKDFAVVYLLHGAYGNYQNWIKKVPALQTYADLYKILIVCPDGAANSWYFDSPVDTAYKFETHVSTEVPTYIDEHYKTKKDRKYRAIAGLSMGGHGALFIAFRHSKTFGACGSMSGALSVESITKGYDVDKRLGDPQTNKAIYHDFSVLTVIEKYPKDSLAIIIDCGLQDFIIAMSKATHEKMVKFKIPHDYIERPGKHDWFYWANAVQYQLLFFKNYFEKNK